MRKHIFYLLFLGFSLPITAQFDLMMGRSADEIVRSKVKNTSEVHLSSLNISGSTSSKIILNITYFQPDTTVFATYLLMNSECIASVIIKQFKEDFVALDGFQVVSFLNNFIENISNKNRMDIISKFFPIYVFMHDGFPTCTTKISNKSNGTCTYAISSMFYPDVGDLVGLMFSQLNKLKIYEPFYYE